MKLNKKLVAAMVLGFAGLSVGAVGAADKDDSARREGAGYRGKGPHAPMMHAGPGANVELFGLGPFGMHPPKPMHHEGKPGKHRDGKGAESRDGRKAAEEGKQLTEEQRAQRFEEHVKHRVDRVLSSVNGTDDQKSKISAIIVAAQKDLRSMHEQLRSLDERAETLFKAETIDRNAFEQLRVERAKLMDSISQRASTAYLDAASLLDAKQRQQLAERKPMPPKHDRKGDKGGKGDKGDKRGKGERHEHRGDKREAPQAKQPAADDATSN